MDEAKLKKILSDIDVPDADPNAKKRAVNLAMAEFKDHQNKKEKNPQGFSLLARLMGKSTAQQRRDPMERKSRNKLVYGGMATAMAVVLIASVSFTQLENFGTNSKSAQMSLGRGNFSSINRNILRLDDQAAAPPVGRLQLPAEEMKAPGKVQRRMEWGKEMRQAGNVPSRSREVAQNGLGDKLAKNEKPAPQSIAVFDEADAEIAPGYYKDTGRDKFEDFKINPVKLSAEEPVSTFSVDVDTASYSFVRSQLNNGVLPQKDAVRVEEMVNYFDYNYPMPETREQPFKPTVAITPSPWAQSKQLMHIGIKGFDIQGEKPRSNLVFLLDVSGSMNSPDKLPLVKNSMKMLLDSLNPDDTVAIAVYAGAAGTVLEPTKASERSKIMAALDNLRAGGSTAGAAGINLAYQLAEQNFVEDGVNRVILATDGDFNVGITNREELQDFVERKRETGIFLSVLGFGQGNYNDHMMQTLAQNGNGVAAYIDNLNEARKVLVEEANSSLFTIAKDVKIQVEFNPLKVAEYRLIGYETRHLNREDFNNDKVDAGDIGAGHTVTAIYEITPVGSESVSVDPLRYGQAAENNFSTKEQCEETTGRTCILLACGTAECAEQKGDTWLVAKSESFSDEYAFLKIRYKLPDEDKSKLITTPVTSDNDLSLIGVERPKWMIQEPGFATAVASFAQLLKGGQYTGDFSYDQVISLAQETKGDDPFGTRAEFINLVRLAKSASTMQPR